MARTRKKCPRLCDGESDGRFTEISFGRTGFGAALGGGGRSCLPELVPLILKLVNNEDQRKGERAQRRDPGDIYTRLSWALSTFRNKFRLKCLLYPHVAIGQAVVMPVIVMLVRV